MRVAELIRARLSVEYLRDGLVCVRETRGNRIEIETFAVRDACGNWLFDDTGRLVDDKTRSAIDREIRATRAATAPPS